MTAPRLPNVPLSVTTGNPDLAQFLAALLKVVQDELDRQRNTYQRLQDPAVLPIVTVAQLNTSAGGSSFYRNVSAGRMVWVSNLSGGAGPAICNSSGWKTWAITINVS